MAPFLQNLLLGEFMYVCTTEELGWRYFNLWKKNVMMAILVIGEALQGRSLHAYLFGLNIDQKDTFKEFSQDLWAQLFRTISESMQKDGHFGKTVPFKCLCLSFLEYNVIKEEIIILLNLHMTQVSGWVDVVEVGLYSSFLYEVSCIILLDYKQFDIKLNWEV